MSLSAGRFLGYRLAHASATFQKSRAYGYLGGTQDDTANVCPPRPCRSSGTKNNVEQTENGLFRLLPARASLHAWAGAEVARKEGPVAPSRHPSDADPQMSCSSGQACTQILTGVAALGACHVYHRCGAPTPTVTIHL